MTNEEQIKLHDIFYSAIQGGSTDWMESILERAVEDGELTEDFVHDNELAIAYYFDDHWFTCVVCGWTMPISDMGEDTEGGELQCEDCSNG